MRKSERDTTIKPITTVEATARPAWTATPPGSNFPVAFPGQVCPFCVKNGGICQKNRFFLLLFSIEFFFIIATITTISRTGHRWRYKRIDWNNHVEHLRHTNKFQSLYYLTEESFDKLAGILGDKITIHANQSMRNSTVFPRIKAYGILSE